MKLQLQVNSECADTTVYHGAMMITPKINESYWLFRVPVSDSQAIVGFPKFGLIGIGFQHEADWNTNLPSQVAADQIYQHIKHNKGDDAIPDERCVEAIKLVQAAATDYTAHRAAGGRA